MTVAIIIYSKDLTVWKINTILGPPNHLSST